MAYLTLDENGKLVADSGYQKKKKQNQVSLPKPKEGEYSTFQTSSYNLPSAITTNSKQSYNIYKQSEKKLNYESGLLKEKYDDAGIITGSGYIPSNDRQLYLRKDLDNHNYVQMKEDYNNKKYGSSRLITASEREQENSKKYKEFSKQQDVVEQTNKVNNLYDETANNYYKYLQDKVAEEDVNLWDKTGGQVVRGMISPFTIGRYSLKNKNGENYIMPTYDDLKTQKVNNSYKTWYGKILGGAAHELGKLTTSYGMNALVPGSGAVGYYSNIYMGQLNNAIAEGYDSKSAAVYATLGSALEYYSGKILGGTTNAVFGTGTSELSNSISRGLSRVITNHPQIVSALSNAISEGSEEFIQEYLDRINKAITLGSKDKIFTKETFEDAVYSASIGMITGGTIGSISPNEYSTRESSLNTQINNKNNSINELLEKRNNNLADINKVNKIDNKILQNQKDVNSLTNDLNNYYQKNSIVGNKINTNSQYDILPIEDAFKAYNNKGARSEQEIKLLIKDIQKNGFDNPIYISKETGKIVDGHHRLDAAKELGLKEIPVKYIESSNDIDIDNERWYNLLEKEINSYGENEKGNNASFKRVQNERLNNNRSNGIVENERKYQNGIGLYKEIQGNSNRPSNETIYGKNPIMGQELDNSSFNLPINKNNTSYQGNQFDKAHGRGITTDEFLNLQENKLADNTKENKKALKKLEQVRNNPEAEITIYRATPGDTINNGDWVFLTKEEADNWSRSPITKTLKKGFKIVEKQVKANEVDWSGKNLEFVYSPKTNMQDIKIPTSEDIKKLKDKDINLPLESDAEKQTDFEKSINSFASEHKEELKQLNSFYNDLSSEIEKSRIEDNKISLPKDPTKASSYETNDINKIAKILDSKPDTSIGKENKLKTWLATKILDKGYYIDKIARKYNNKELSAKYDYSLMHSAIANQIIGNGRYDNKGNKIGKSLYEIFAPIEDANLVKEFSEYMYHKHNADRMSLDLTFREENKPVFGSSITADKSSQIVFDYEESYPQFEKWSKEIYDYNNQNLDMLVNSGVISQSDKNYYNQKYPHYVPIVRNNDYTRNGMIKKDGNQLFVGTPIKRAEGGHTDMIPLKDAMAMKTMQTTSSALKNDFGQELLMTLFGDNYTDMFENNMLIDDVIDGDNEILKPKSNGNEATFTIFSGGQQLTIPISDELFEALTPRNSKTFKPLNKANNIRRALLTEYNPTFMLTNPIKDIQDGLINSKYPKQFIKNIPEAINQIKNKGKIYQLYIANGGSQETYFNYDKGTNFESKKMYIPTGNKFLDTIKIPLKVLDKISDINNVIEMTPRLSEFISSIDAGESIQTAMYNAQEITTNFKRGGDVAKNLDRNGATFLNASIQGFTKQIRNVQEAKVNGLRGMSNLIVKSAAVALPAILLNNMIWGDDDEDYNDLSDYIKNNYYIIGKYGDGKFVRIPKGRATSVIQKFYQNIVDEAQGKEVDIEGFTDLLKNQIFPSDPTESNLFSPLIQAFKTKNGEAWYGGDLVPKRLQSLPNAEQYDESTDSISIWLGKKLNISPYKINYILDQYSGAVGDYILPYLTQESESPNDSIIGKTLAPISDKFVTDSVMKNQNVSDFYELNEKFQKSANSMNATSEDKLKYKYLSSVSSEISKLYTEKREIQASNLKDSEKYNKSKEIQKKINNLAKNGIVDSKKVTALSDYGKVNNQEYYLNSKKEWTKVKEEETTELNNLKMTDNEKNTYFKIKVENSKIKSNESLSSSEKNKQIANNVINSNFSEEKLAYLYSNYYSDEETLNNLLTMNIPIKEYIKLNSEDLSGDYNVKTGKTISGSKKNKVINYVNSLKLSIPQKAILIKSQYSTYKDYDKEIINYVNKINISANEKKMLLKSIGFNNYNNDIVNYINSQNISKVEKEKKLKSLGFTIRDGRVYWQ